MRNKIQAVLIALLMGLGLVAVTATPALAADCPANNFCIHKQGSLPPYWKKTPPQLPANTCVTVSPQDYTRYVENATNYIVDVYLTGSCASTPNFGRIYAHTGGPMDANWSDRIRGVIRRPAGKAPEGGQTILAGGKDVIWTKSGSVPISYTGSARSTVLPPFCGPECQKAKAAKAANVTVAALQDPSNCQGQFGIWENVSSPWGDYRCFSANITRNQCNYPGGPAREFTMNYTSFWWMVFRPSDTTCSGAHLSIRPRLGGGGPSSGASWGYDASWPNFGGVMRTSST
jgi:hypothetical protein